MLVGLGEEAKLVGDAGLETWRRAAASFVRAAGSGATAAFLVPRELTIPLDRIGAAVAEGGILASYRYDAFRTAEPPDALGRLLLAVGSPEEAIVDRSRVRPRLPGGGGGRAGPRSGE